MEYLPSKEELKEDKIISLAIKIGRVFADIDIETRRKEKDKLDIDSIIDFPLVYARQKYKLIAGCVLYIIKDNDKQEPITFDEKEILKEAFERAKTKKKSRSKIEAKYAAMAEEEMIEIYGDKLD